MGLLDGQLCQRAQRLVDIIIIVSTMAVKQQALEDLTNLAMGPTDPCEIVLRNQAMVPSGGDWSIALMIARVIPGCTVRRIISSADGSAIAGLRGRKRIASVDERLSHLQIVDPWEAHANAMVKISWPWARGALSSHQLSSNVSRRAWAWPAESDV
jgi:hypothetical protein